MNLLEVKEMLEEQLNASAKEDKWHKYGEGYRSLRNTCEDIITRIIREVNSEGSGDRLLNESDFK